MLECQHREPTRPPLRSHGISSGRRQGSGPSLLVGRYEDAIGDAELSYSIASRGGRRLDGEIRKPGVVGGKRVGEQKWTKLKMMACRWSQRQGVSA